MYAERVDTIVTTVLPLRLASLSIQTYDDWAFNPSRKRGPGGPNDLVGRKYGSRTRPDIGQFPPPSLFTCKNLYCHPSELSAPLSIVTIALPSLRTKKNLAVLFNPFSDAIHITDTNCSYLFEYRPWSSVKRTSYQSPPQVTT